MYVQLLSSALYEWVHELSGPPLIAEVRLRRAEMLAPGGHDDAFACGILAAEVAYDCALIKLSAAMGIEATIEQFAHPPVERVRLERALANAGIDIISLVPISRVA